MLKKILSYLYSYFKGGETRTQKLKQNVAWSTVIKVISIFIELIKVPILLSYLSSEKYGVWLTIISILMWTRQFDLGLGSGLRYKLTEAMAKDDSRRCKQLVSTAYFSLGAIMLSVLIICTPILSIINWNSVLNVENILNEELILSIGSVFIIFTIQFIVELISTILKAQQRAALSDIFKPIGSVLSLIVILTLKFWSTDSLLYASIAMALPYMLVLLVANLYYFKTKLKLYSPSIKCYRKGLIKDIYSLGFKYFLEQMASLIVFSTSNILLSHYINPVEVTTYNIARTYFGLAVIFYSMILIPFSAATTDAYVRNDISWIKNSMNKLHMLAIFLSIGIFISLLIYPFAIKLWVGDNIIVPLSLAIGFTIYNCLNLLVSPYANFMAAVGKMNIRVIISVFKILTFIPIGIFAIKLFGAVGLVMTIILVNTMINYIFGIIQYDKLITNKAKGIWNT